MQKNINNKQAKATKDRLCRKI